MREESDQTRDTPMIHPIRRPPSPPSIRERSRSPLGQATIFFGSLRDNEREKSQPDVKKRCIHYPEIFYKLCYNFFVLGKCVNRSNCRFAHHILEPIKVDYCHKYIDQDRRKECSGTFETKCGKPHIGFRKLNRKYQKEVRDLHLNCKQCGNNNTRNTDDRWSDVSSVDESRIERGSNNRSLIREKSPNRFKVKNELMKGNLASKSTKCVNCPISDEFVYF